MRFGVLLLTKISTYPAAEDTASRRRGLRIFHSAKMGSACSEDTRLRCRANLANFGRTW